MISGWEASRSALRRGRWARSSDVQEVGIERFIGQGEADDVEIGQGMFVLQAVERDVVLPEGGFHILPGGEGPFSGDVLPFVEDVIEQGDAKVGLTQVIDIGEDQRHM